MSSGSSRVPKLPLIPASGGGTVGSSQSARGKSSARGGTLVSSSRTQYRPLATPTTSSAAGGASSAADGPRTLTPRDLHHITKYINANKSLQPQHRAGRLGDIIPPVPFEKIEAKGDTNLGLRLARINPNESALDIPLRFAIPAEYHVPAMNDLSMQAGSASSLGTRLMTMLKGTSQVPQHSQEEKEGTERDVAHCNVIRDWEMRATVAKRGGQPRAHAVALLALGSLHYKAANREKALRYFTDAAQSFEQSGDARGAALCHNLLGVACMHLARHSDAMLHHRKQGSLSGPFGRCVAQLNLGVGYGAMGNHDASVQVLQDALRSADDAGDDVLLAIARGNLGIALMRQGDLRQAQFNIEGCLEQCSVAGDKVGAGVCLLLLSDMYCQLGDFTHAQFYAEHALRVGTDARCYDVADVAKVTIGVARGALSAQAAVMEAAKRMGTGVTAEQVIATLPQH